MHHGAAQSQRQRQRPPVLVLRYCPRPPRRHLAARNTKGTGARPQPRTTPPPRSAPAPCPARPALLLSFAPSPPRASSRALPCDAPVPCQCPALRRCGHARPAVTCNSAKQRARQSPRPPPHATTRRPTPAPRPAIPPSRVSAPPCAAAAIPAPLSPATAQSNAHAKARVHHHATATPPHAASRQRPGSRASVNTAPLRHRTPRRHLRQGKNPALRRCGLPRPIINLQQGKARSTERQPGGERARKQGLRWCKIINVVPAAKQDEASTAARIPRSQVFPGGRGHYEQIGTLLRGTWTCGRGPAARGSGMVSLGSKLG